MPETTETEKTEDKGSELFAQQTARTNDLLAELLEQNKLERAHRTQPKAPEPVKEAPVWTREQLQAAVDEGKITTADMVDYLSELKTSKAVAKAREELKAEFAADRLTGTVEQKIAAYRAEHPDLTEKGSATRAAVVEKFNELVELGYDPKDLRTELVACQFVVDGKKAPVKETTSTRVRSIEASGSRSGGNDASGSDKWPKWVPAENRAFYETQIDKGRYKDMNDEKLKKDLGYLKKQLEDPKRSARRGAA